ncbi:MAG: AmmeMemoRadiSam system protein B [Planctomycetia bacterium]
MTSAVSLGDVREPAHAGVAYSAHPDRLRADLDRLFTGPGGPGLPTLAASPPAGPRLRAVLAPHIDFPRGAGVVAHSFKALAERSTASLFFLVGTSHYSYERFTLSRQHFRTPLGVAETDRNVVDRLAAAYGPKAYADSDAHRPEHSLELEILFLQHLLAGRRDFRIVPLLVGSFHDAVRDGVVPKNLPDVARMIAALRDAIADAGEDGCVVVSGDLAHIGPKFGDRRRIDAAADHACRAADLALLNAIETGGAPALATYVAAEADRRRLCGFPPLYTTLEALPNAVGRTLRYDRYVDPNGAELVSFAAAAFEDPGAACDAKI